MTRGIQVAHHTSENDVSVLARIMAVLLCPKSMDGDGVCFDEDESRPVFHFHVQSSSTSAPQLPTTVSIDTTEETERLTDIVIIDLTRSPSPLTKMDGSSSPLGRCGKRFCDYESGPSQKRSVSHRLTMSADKAGPSDEPVLDRATMPLAPFSDKAGPSQERFPPTRARMQPSTSSDASFAEPSRVVDTDAFTPNTQSKSFVSAVLEHYDAIIQECRLVRVSPMVAPVGGESLLQRWEYWVKLFSPCKNNQQRQDGIAALAQLRHMICRRGFLRFATDLASLSQIFRTHQSQVYLIRNFMKEYGLMSQLSLFEVSNAVKWGPLRQLVETGECPAWLLHKALQDQMDAAGSLRPSLRPFLSFLAAAAEIYKALPKRVLQNLEKEEKPAAIAIHYRTRLVDERVEARVRHMKEPGVTALLELKTRYFSKLSLPKRLFLTAFLSYLGSMRYVKQWSPAETFVLDLANAMGTHLEVAVELAERPSTAGYWDLMPQLAQLVSVDNLPRYKLRAKCKDLLKFLDIRLTDKTEQHIIFDDLDVFWSLAETLYELLTSPRTLQAAIKRKKDLVKKLADSKDLLLKEDPPPCWKLPVLLPAKPLIFPSTAEHLPASWRKWAALRETVLPEGTSHRDMEALVDIQLRPYVGHSHNVMNFISSIASVMWPREWFQEEAVSSYDGLLRYFHNPIHLRYEEGGRNIFGFVNTSKGKSPHLQGWVKRGECSPVTLAAALKNPSLYSLLFRAANMFFHVSKSFSQQSRALTSWLIPDFPQTDESIKDPALDTFRAHAAHFFEPDEEFRKMLRVLLSIRSFNELTSAEQVVLDLATALCVSLPGEPGHSPFWTSAETFHSIMAKRPKWQELFASPDVNRKVKEAYQEAFGLFDLSCWRLTTLYSNLCAHQASDEAKQLKNFRRFLAFAQYVFAVTGGEWVFRRSDAPC